MEGPPILPPPILLKIVGYAHLMDIEDIKAEMVVLARDPKWGLTYETMFRHSKHALWQSFGTVPSECNCMCCVEGDGHDWTVGGHSNESSSRLMVLKDDK
jgi:hypothetical protein